MLTAILSIVSSQALWVLTQDQALVDSLSWDDDQSIDLSHQIGLRLSELLSRNKLSSQNITRIGVVDGPGAFTGLRSSAAFAKGFAEARKIPAFGIPTYMLYQRELYMPLQHQRMKGLSVSDALASGLEFLKVSGPRTAEIARPSADDFILGVAERSHWPSVEAVVSAASSQLPIDIFYGLNPKISGQR